jgi:ATP synthase I chain
MNSSPTPPDQEERLSGAYQRILRVAIVLSVIAVVIATLLGGWRSGLGLAIGASLAYLNFVWLHHGTERLVQRILTSGKAPSKVRFAFPFPLRYVLLIAAVYVILKSYPGLLVGFLVGLILPIVASMGEGVYEAVVISKIDRASN